MWVRRGRLRCAFVAIMAALVAASAGDLVEDANSNHPANLAPEVKELALEDLVDVTPSGKEAHATPKGKPKAKSHDKPAKKKGDHVAKKKEGPPVKKSTPDPKASKKNKAGEKSHGKKSKPSAKSGAATDKKAKKDYGTVAAPSPAKALKSRGSVKKEGKGETSWNPKTGFGTTFHAGDGAIPGQHQAPTRLGEATPNIVAIKTAQAAQENGVQQAAFQAREKTQNTLNKDTLSAGRLRDRYKKQLKEHAIKLMARFAGAGSAAKKKVKELKARLQKETMIHAGKYVAEKTQAAAIKFATIDVVAKHLKHTGKKLVKGRDKVAIAKRKIAEKKAKDKSSDMVKAAMLAAKNKLSPAPQKRDPKEPA